MRFSGSYDYPVSLDTLWELFKNVDYPEKKYRSFGALDYKLLSHQASEDKIRVELQRTIPIDLNKVPSLVKRFITPTQEMRHLTIWQRMSPTLVNATIEVETYGKPVTVNATGTVTQISEHVSRLVLNYDIRSTVPLIGEKIAALFASQVKESMKDDYAFTVKYIQQQQ